METPELFFSELSPIENNILEQNYNVYEGDVVLVISINIGDGRSDEIKVYENDNTDQLAMDFCYKHKLGARAKVLLVEEIEKYLKVALSQSVPLTHPQEAAKSGKSKVSPARAGRNQTFSQRSMQVRQNVFKSSNKKPFEKGSISINDPIGKKNLAVKAQSISNSYNSSPSKKLNGKSVSLYDPNILKNFNKKSSPESVPQSQKPNKNLDKSARIMKKLKYNRYKEIFSYLLPNANGVISSESVKKSQISNNLCKILQPLFEELDELKETLDFNEFYDAMEMLMKVLTPGEKSDLFLPKKAKKTLLEVPKAKPSHHRNMSSSSLYERSIVKKQEFSRRIEKEKSIIEEAEMKECKFIPAITSFNKQSISSKSFNGIS